MRWDTTANRRGLSLRITLVVLMGMGCLVAGVVVLYQQRIVPATARIQEAQRRIQTRKKEITDEPQRTVDAKTGQIEIGSIRITVMAATVGKAPLRGNYQTVDDLLTIKLKITNLSETKKVDYRGWLVAPELFLMDKQPDYATLSDDLGNEYHRSWRGNFQSGLVGDADKNSIYPEESFTDIVVFQKPVDAARELILSLNLRQIGGTGRAQFKIPMPMPFVR